MWYRRALVCIVAIAILVAWWLFHDTYRRHAGLPVGGLEIRFAHFGSHEDYEFWRGVIADFERDHTGTRIHQEYTIGPGDQYDINMRRQFLSDRPPDVALIHLTQFRELAENFEDLGEFVEGAPRRNIEGSAEQKKRPSLFADPHPTFIHVLEPTGLKAFQIGDAQRGLPVSGRNLLIYVNRKCFERAARFHNRPVPLPADDWTIEDFIRTAEMLTCDFDRDGRIDQFGFRLPRWVYYLPFIWSFGAEVTDADTARWTLAGPKAEAALWFYRRLATGDRVCPHEEEVPQLLQDTGFLTGRIAMCVNGPWFMSFLDKTDLADSYAVAPIPRGPGGRATLITWDGAVMKKGLPPDRRDIASRFIESMLSREVQDRLARSGRALPARTESQSAFIAPDESRRRPFVEAVSYSRLQPILPNFDALERIIDRHLADAADPTRPFRADAILDALAREPDIARTFARLENKSP